MITDGNGHRKGIEIFYLEDAVAIGAEFSWFRLTKGIHLCLIVDFVLFRLSAWIIIGGNK